MEWTLCNSRDDERSRAHLIALEFDNNDDEFSDPLLQIGEENWQEHY